MKILEDGEQDDVERVSQGHQVFEIDGQLTNAHKLRRGCECVFSIDSTDSFSTPKTTPKDVSAERRASMQKLILAVSLCVVFMIVEVVGGIKANSLAILADAAHLLSDVVAFALSLFSLWAAGWEVTPTHSFGFHRVEIIGALLSVQLIWLLSGILVYRAIHNLIHHTSEVHGSLMFAVASFGLIVNITMAIVLGHHGHHYHHHSHHDHEEAEENKPLYNKEKGRGRNLNLQAAYLHALGDSIQSIGVMIGGGLIWYKPEWKIIDLICTLVFSVIVLGTTVGMLRRMIEVLMESTPRELDATRVEKGVCEIDGVFAVHEFHIWAITVGNVRLSCHVTIEAEADADVVLEKVVEYIKMEHHIDNVTIQVEKFI